MCGAAWSWMVRKSCIWSPSAKYSAICWCVRALADEPGLGAHPGVVAAERHAWRAASWSRARRPPAGCRSATRVGPSSLTARYRTRAACAAWSSSTGTTRHVASPSGASTNRSTTVTSLSAPASMTSRGNTATPSPAIAWVTTIGSATTLPAGTAEHDVGVRTRRSSSANTSGVRRRTSSRRRPRRPRTSSAP